MSFLEWLRSVQASLGWVFLASFVGLVVSVALLMHSVLSKLPKYRFQQKAMLTENEREFFGRLKRALPDFDVCPQVAMGALLDTGLPQTDPQHLVCRRAFAQKIVDFVVYRDGRVVAVIELDDRTHDPKKDAERDAMLASAGISTIRFDSRAKPEPSEIRRRVLALAGASS